MNPRSQSNEWYGRFEAALRREVSDSRIDYDALWASLSARIDQADALGALGVLKSTEMPSGDFWDRVEHGLMERVVEHDEYEVPVDECIAEERGTTEARWKRVEAGLFGRIDATERLEPWEQVLKAEEIPAVGMMERTEERLLSRIEENQEPPSRRFTWPALFLFSPAFAKTAVVLVVAAVTGILLYRNLDSSLPTYVYQASGADAELVGRSDPHASRVASRKGGAVRLANRHGYVHLRNGAGLRLARVDARTARYELDMSREAGRGLEGGSATFFVTPRRASGSFVLATPDYEVVVTGTYFRVLPDLGDRTSTQVLEGSVRVHGRGGEEYVLEAGQSLVFDPETQGYRVEGGGPVVSREEVDVMPDLESIESHRILVVTASVPFTGVTIDGIHRGTTPLRILLPAGKHHLRLERDRYRPVDTTVVLGGQDLARLYAVLTERPRRVSLAKPARPGRRRAAAEPADTGTGEAKTPEEPSAGTRWRRLLERAERAEHEDWRRAVALYQELVDGDGVSALIRQTALFSIGRLWAEHGQSTTPAKEAFLRYLALYPYGTFTRESLLRLAELEFETDPDKAIEYYRKYFEKYPTHYRVPELQYRVGLIYLQGKRYDEAIHLFRQSLAALTGDRGNLRSRVYTGLHKALSAKGDTENARLIEQKYLSSESRGTGH